MSMERIVWEIDAANARRNQSIGRMVLHTDSLLFCWSRESVNMKQDSCCWTAVLQHAEEAITTVTSIFVRKQTVESVTAHQKVTLSFSRQLSYAIMHFGNLPKFRKVIKSVYNEYSLVKCPKFCANLQYYFLPLTRLCLSEYFHIFGDSLFFNSKLISNAMNFELILLNTLGSNISCTFRGLAFLSKECALLECRLGRDWKERDEEEGYECERSQGERQREREGRKRWRWTVVVAEVA